jgi:hypothetical protein
MESFIIDPELELPVLLIDDVVPVSTDFVVSANRGEKTDRPTTKE